MTLKHHFRAALSTFAMAAVLAGPAIAEQSGKTPIPDFTKGGKIPTRATHDWCKRVWQPHHLSTEKGNLGRSPVNGFSGVHPILFR
jgi:hypothetical protein